MKRKFTLFLSLLLSLSLFSQGKILDLTNKNNGPKIKVENLKKVNATPIAIPLAGRNFSPQTFNFQPLPYLSPPSWPTVTASGKSGLAIALEGTLPQAYKAATKNIGEQGLLYFEIMKDAIGLKTPEKELEVTKAWKDDLNIHHIRYQQVWEGIPVHGGEWLVHARDNEIFFANGRNHPSPQTVQSEKNISKNEALHLCFRDLATKETIERPATLPLGIDAFDWDETALVYYPDDNNVFRLSWQMDIHPNLVKRYRYFVDAESGAIIDSYPTHCGLTHEDFSQESKKENKCEMEITVSKSAIQPASSMADGARTATARDLFNINRTINTYEVGNTFYMIDASRPMHNPGGSNFPDNALGVIWTIDARNTSPENSNFNAFHVTSGNNSWNNQIAVSAHYNGGESYLYFKNVHGRNSINDQNGNMLSFINVVEADGSDMDNAFWNGKFMFYGNGNIGFSSPLAKGLDVAGHEMSHGVIQTTANLEYRNESGALNESFADVFGAMIDRDDWKIGDDVANPNFFLSGTMRDMADPHNGGNSLNDNGWQPKHYNERYTGSQDNGGVHINSGIPNHAYYLFATASGVGKDKAEKVFYRALNNYLVASSQFVDLRVATMQAAADLYGANSAVSTALKNALDAVGIPGGSGGNYQNDHPENPGDPYMITSDINETAIYLVDGNGNVIGNPFINFGSVSRVSVTDDGSYAVFIGEDNTMYEINFTNNSFQQIQDEAIWRNVAISKDGSRLAAITLDFDNLIYVYDFGRQEWATFELYNPTYSSGVSTGDVAYPDILEWDFSGQWVMYDAFNELGTGFGNIDYWDIGFCNVWNTASGNFATGEVAKLFSGLAENTSVGNPTFSKRSPYIIAFDYLDNSVGDFWVMTANLETGDVSDPPIFENLVIGYPNFSPSDRFLSYDAESTEGDAIIALQELNSNKLSAAAGPTIFITGGTKGVWFADGVRPLSTDEKNLLKSGKILPNPVSDYFKIDLENNNQVNKVLLVNTLGQVVKDLPGEQIQSGWHIGDLPAGIYTLMLIDTSQRHFASMRLVKK